MAKQNREPENEEIGKDLCDLARLLTDEGLCMDASFLDSAGKVCAKIPGDNKWKYSFAKLDFSLDEVGSTIPADASEIILRFSININGKTEEAGKICDPLDWLAFDIEVLGQYYHEPSDEIRDMYCSWHLDRHISVQGDGENKFSHPLYHFAFGGKKMEEKGLDFGSTLILPSPRFAYPPMDAVLGIDFIIKNYIHRDKIKKLTRNPDYIRIIKKSQIRLWLPYSKSMYSYWDKLGHTYSDGFDHKAVFPFYI